MESQYHHCICTFLRCIHVIFGSLGFLTCVVAWLLGAQRATDIRLQQFNRVPTRGPVPPADANPCTIIPRRGIGRCKLEMDFDHHEYGHAAHAPPVFPHLSLGFDAASVS
ncbi:hypothetical protein ACOSQ3_014904 [Xanthoceras sorbifolium]